MRVVAGTARGRSLAAPSGRRTRPTSDRVRESVFNMLTSMDALEGAAVADLFAGTGALGIEALSRGAASAVLVDDDRDAVAVIRANLAVLGPAAASATVVRAAVETWVGRDAGPYDLVFADPPYAWDGWGRLLPALAASGAALVVAETAPGWEQPPGWDPVRSRTYGTTMVTLLRPAPIASGAPAAPVAHEHLRGGM